MADAPTQRPRRRFFWARVAVLSVLLLAVLVYAWRDVRRRRERNEWTRTLDVGLILVRRGPVPAQDLEAIRRRVVALESVLMAEMRAYRPVTHRPFQFTVYGPVTAMADPPSAPDDDGWASLLRYSFEQWSYLRRIDEAADVPTRRLDTRIYLFLRPGTGVKDGIEGVSELGGRVGMVSVDLGEDMADFALFVATHEMLHTLGASDKYAPDGRILVPSGLGDPLQRPLYPQRRTEVMARHRAVDETHDEPPDGLDELAVGVETAREIGWLSAPPAR